MALVKRSKITSEAAQIAEPVLAEGNSKSKSAARPARGRSREETVAERLAAATEQLASGLNQAAAATRELESAKKQPARPSNSLPV
jgi:methyl-accepting chemotaxis protein